MLEPAESMQATPMDGVTNLFNKLSNKKIKISILKTCILTAESDEIDNYFVLVQAHCYVYAAYGINCSINDLKYLKRFK